MMDFHTNITEGKDLFKAVLANFNIQLDINAPIIKFKVWLNVLVGGVIGLCLDGE